MSTSAMQIPSGPEDDRPQAWRYRITLEATRRGVAWVVSERWGPLVVPVGSTMPSTVASGWSRSTVRAQRKAARAVARQRRWHAREDAINEQVDA